MLPPRACVAAEQGLKEKYMKPATAATLAQGDIDVEAGRRAALGGDVDEQSGLPQERGQPPTAGTRTATLLGGLTAQLWGGKVKAQALQKP